MPLRHLPQRCLLIILGSILEVQFQSLTDAIAETHNWVGQQSPDGVVDGLPKNPCWQQFADRSLLKTRDKLLQTTQRKP